MRRLRLTIGLLAFVLMAGLLPVASVSADVLAPSTDDPRRTGTGGGGDRGRPDGHRRCTRRLRHGRDVTFHVDQRRRPGLHRGRGRHVRHRRAICPG